MATELVERVGLRTLEDLTMYSIGNVVQLLEIKPSAFGIRMLKQLFGLKEKQVKSDAVLYIAKGYNILNDDFRPSAIFNVNTSVLQVGTFSDDYLNEWPCRTI